MSFDIVTQYNIGSAVYIDLVPVFAFGLTFIPIRIISSSRWSHLVTPLAPPDERPIGKSRSARHTTAALLPPNVGTEEAGTLRRTTVGFAYPPSPNLTQLCYVDSAAVTQR